MSLDPTKSESCHCGNIYIECAGRFGADTGDMPIEIYEIINRIR